MTANNERTNPFGDLSSDFAASPQAKKPILAANIDNIAEANGFPSRQPQKTPKPTTDSPSGATGQHRTRRYTTGRNRQLNLKASDETIKAFYELADQRGITLAELFEQAVAALRTTKLAS